MNAITVNVEEKLFQNRYRVDAGRPHIKIKDADVCTNTCVVKSCTFVCPASCYKVEGNGTVTLITGVESAELVRGCVVETPAFDSCQTNISHSAYSCQIEFNLATEKHDDAQNTSAPCGHRP